MVKIHSKIGLNLHFGDKLCSFLLLELELIDQSPSIKMRDFVDQNLSLGFNTFYVVLEAIDSSDIRVYFQAIWCVDVLGVNSIIVKIELGNLAHFIFMASCIDSMIHQRLGILVCMWCIDHCWNFRLHLFYFDSLFRLFLVNFRGFLRNSNLHTQNWVKIWSFGQRWSLSNFQKFSRFGLFSMVGYRVGSTNWPTRSWFLNLWRAPTLA